MVFLDIRLVRYSSTIPVWPLIMANISGERPALVETANSFLPCQTMQLHHETDVKCELTAMSLQKLLSRLTLPVQQAM